MLSPASDAVTLAVSSLRVALDGLLVEAVVVATVAELLKSPFDMAASTALEMRLALGAVAAGVEVVVLAGA